MSSFKAELHINGEIRAILNASQSFSQFTDASGNPTTKPIGNVLELWIESTKDDSFFYENMFSPTAQIKGKIVFYKRDNIGILFKMEFQNGHITGLNEYFDARGTMPMHMRLNIGWGAMKIKNTILREYWGDKDAFIENNVQPTTLQTEEDELEKKPQIINGWFTKNKNDSENLKKAKLGDTVYFHVETKDIDNGEEIELKLYEQDKNIFMRDFLDPDDDEFLEEEVIKKATVNNNKATVELVLQESWESMIKDDSDNAFSLDENLELYWEIKYQDISKSLPNRESLYLKVAFSDRTLYFKTPIATHNLPEFISYDGDPMLLMEFAKGFVKGKVKKKILDNATKQANSKIKKIAFTKLKKGYMADNNGKVYTGKRLIYEYKKMYSNSGELFENVKKGKDFGYNHGDGLNTTKGISQYDYFSKNGKRVTLLRTVKSIGNVFDIFSLVKFTMDDLDTSEPLPLDFGPLSPIADLAGVLVQEQKAEMDAWLEETVQLEVDEAKLKGLGATRKAINTWNHNKEFKWELLAISNQTANKLLQGEFKTFEELYEFNIENEPESTKIEVLYRKVRNNNREEDIYVIETIFINE